MASLESCLNLGVHASDGARRLEEAGQEQHGRLGVPVRGELHADRHPVGTGAETDRQGWKPRDVESDGGGMDVLEGNGLSVDGELLGAAFVRGDRHDWQQQGVEAGEVLDEGVARSLDALGSRRGPPTAH